MQSRRQLLQSGLAVSAAALVPLHSSADACDSLDLKRLRPELFIYDDQHAAALDAARQAQRNDVRIASTREVLTHLWYDELDLGWRLAPMTLAGATTARGLHVIETLALDRRMRVIERIETPGDDLIHWLIAPVQSPAQSPESSPASPPTRSRRPA